MALIQMRRDTKEAWESANPVLAAGEFGFAKDSGVLKIGDGTHPWNQLPGNNIGFNNLWSASDSFNQANGALSGQWGAICRYSSNEYVKVVSNQATRTGAPGGSDWCDGAVWLQEAQSTAHQSSAVIATIGSGATASFTGDAVPGVILRASGVTGNFTANQNNNVFANRALFCCISTTTWFVFLGDLAGNSALADRRVEVARGSRSMSAGATLTAAITAADQLTVTYGGVQLWQGTVPNAPQGKQVGITCGKSSALDDFAAQ